jgi:hypothetical protein
MELLYTILFTNFIFLWFSRYNFITFVLLLSIFNIIRNVRLYMLQNSVNETPNPFLNGIKYLFNGVNWVTSKISNTNLYLADKIPCIKYVNNKYTELNNYFLEFLGISKKQMINQFSQRFNYTLMDGKSSILDLQPSASGQRGIASLNLLEGQRGITSLNLLEGQRGITSLNLKEGPGSSNQLKNPFLLDFTQLNKTMNTNLIKEDAKTTKEIIDLNNEYRKRNAILLNLNNQIMPTLNNIISSFDKLNKETVNLTKEDNLVKEEEVVKSDNLQEKNIYLYDSDEDSKKNN